MWGLHILLPLIPNLSLAALPPDPCVLRGMLGYLRLFMPDVSWIALICGGFAGMWTFLRTGLILRTPAQTPDVKSWRSTATYE